MYFCYGYCIDVYLDWFPKYLNDSRGFSLQQMGLFASLPLLAGTAGDILGGWFSDLWARHTGNLRLARRATAMCGYFIAAACIIPSCLTSSSFACVWYACIAVFGLELTVGVSWAIPLDIGGTYAGSVAAVMNTFGNLGGATASAVSAYLVSAYGWKMPFLVVAGLCCLAALLYLRICADRPLAFQQ